MTRLTGAAKRRDRDFLTDSPRVQVGRELCAHYVLYNQRSTFSSYGRNRNPPRNYIFSFGRNRNHAETVITVSVVTEIETEAIRQY